HISFAIELAADPVHTKRALHGGQVIRFLRRHQDVVGKRHGLVLWPLGWAHWPALTALLTALLGLWLLVRFWLLGLLARLLRLCFVRYLLNLIGYRARLMGWPCFFIGSASFCFRRRCEAPSGRRVNPLQHAGGAAGKPARIGEDDGYPLNVRGAEPCVAQ